MLLNALLLAPRDWKNKESKVLKISNFFFLEKKCNSVIFSGNLGNRILIPKVVPKYIFEGYQGGVPRALSLVFSLLYKNK